eukprot:scaffold358973_cov43-Prasinocladus_malaysianus.AAC.1
MLLVFDSYLEVNIALFSPVNLPTTSAPGHMDALGSVSDYPPRPPSPILQERRLPNPAIHAQALPDSMSDAVASALSPTASAADAGQSGSSRWRD